MAAAFARSKQTAAAFCVSHDLKESTFSWWRSQLRHPDVSRRKTAGVRLVAVDVAKREVLRPPSDARVEVAFAGLAVRVEVGTDTEYLAALVADLRSRC